MLEVCLSHAVWLYTVVLYCAIYLGNLIAWSLTLRWSERNNVAWQLFNYYQVIQVGMSGWLWYVYLKASAITAAVACRTYFHMLSTTHEQLDLAGVMLHDCAVNLSLLAGWMVGWQGDWLVGWLIDWLEQVCWLGGWLIAWMFGVMVGTFVRLVV